MRPYYPICLLTYNRPRHARITIEALKKNTLAGISDLYIFSDAPSNEEDRVGVEKTREYLETVDGFKSVTVIKMDENKGPFKMAMTVGNYMCEKAEAFIWIEDDVQTSPYFLSYMNDALNFYRDNERVVAVSGYTHEPSLTSALRNYPHDMIFSYAFHAFAWGTWSDRFKKIDWSMPDVEEHLADTKERRRARILSWGHLRATNVAAKNDSELWDIRFSYYMFKNDLVCAWPRYTYANNFGFDGTGIHKYNFSEKWFVIPMDNAKSSLEFTNDIDLSTKLQFNVEVAISARWVFAFLGNLNRVIKEKVKKSDLYSRAAVF